MEIDLLLLFFLSITIVQTIRGAHTHTHTHHELLSLQFSGKNISSPELSCCRLSAVIVTVSKASALCNSCLHLAYVFSTVTLVVWRRITINIDRTLELYLSSVPDTLA